MPYVAPAALLFVTDPAPPPDDLRPVASATAPASSRVAGLVLLVTVGVTVLAGSRLVRPLSALTDAARRMRDGDGSARVTVTGRDEIGRLAAAFNDMSARRERTGAAAQGHGQRRRPRAAHPAEQHPRLAGGRPGRRRPSSTRR